MDHKYTRLHRFALWIAPGSSCLRLGTTINEAGLAPDAGRRAGSMPGSFSLVANMVRAEVVESEWP